VKILKVIIIFENQLLPAYRSLYLYVEAQKL